MLEKSYKKFKSDIIFTNDTYVIIGSGIGGLTTAVFLAKAGKKVVVLEQHYVPGGFTHTFKRKKGLTWDVGVHYVGNMGDTSSLRQIFNYLSDTQLIWDEIGDPYDVAIIGDKTFEFVKGKENFRKKLYEYFPKDTHAIDRYLKLLDASVKKNLLFFIQKAFPKLLDITLGAIFRGIQKTIAAKTTYEVLSSITDNQELIAVLCAQCGNYGLSPKESSFASHCIVINHFMEGGYYPRGGTNRIHETMIDHLQTLGVDVYIKAKVNKIVSTNSRVQGIVVNGKEHACNNVISSVGVHNTFQHLLDQKYVTNRYKRLSKINASTSHLCLYIGLNKSDIALQLPKHNIWWYVDKDIDSALTNTNYLSDDELSFAYISFASAKNSLWASAHPNTATIQLIGMSHYYDFKEYENEPWLNRGASYTHIKEQFAQKGISLLTRLYPQIKNHIIHTEVSTPVSTRTFSEYKQGEIYGLTHAPERYREKGLSPRTTIKGLYLTGQDITVVGVGGAMASGILTASTIVKWNMNKQFRKIRNDY